MRARLVYPVVLLTCWLAGCAGVEVKSVATTDVNEKDIDGFRYYERAPFLLMYTDAKGGVNAQLLYLPDMANKRTIRVYSYLAKNDTTLTFKNGSLMQAKATIDETIVPVAAIAAIEKIGASLFAAANAGKEGMPVPQLFRLVRNTDGKWDLVTTPTTMKSANASQVISFKQDNR